jgi:hypothetical protein
MFNIATNYAKYCVPALLKSAATKHPSKPKLISINFPSQTRVYSNESRNHIFTRVPVAEEAKSEQENSSSNEKKAVGQL